MKIETPQILWHSNADVDKGKAAPLHSCSMLPVETANGNSNSNGNSGNSSSPISSTSRNILATVGNTPEIHLWEVGFSRVNDKAVSAAGTAAANHTAEPTKMDLTAEEAANHPNNNAANTTNGNKRSRILQDGSSSSTSAAAASPHKHVIRHVQTLGRTIDRSLNAVKFSPDGRHLAAAGDGGVVVVYTLPRAHIPILDPTQAPAKNGRVWCEVIGNGGSETAAAGAAGATAGGTATKGSTAATSAAPSNDGERLLRIKVLPSPSTHDVMDVSWSADSKRLTVACLDHTLVTYENVHHDITGIADEEPKWSTVMRSTTDHCGYVQGVAMDPRGIYLASQGADRTVRVWSRKKKAIDKQIQQQLQVEKAEKDGEKNSTGAAGKDTTDKAKDFTAGAKDGQETNTATTADAAVDAAKDQEQQAMPEPELSAEEQLLAQARINVVSSNAFTNGKFELNKAKIIKFRDNSCLEKKEDEKDKDKEGENKGGQETTAAEGDAAAATSQPQPEKEKNVRRQHLFGDESTVESFFRRLSWTADGSYLICPAALWHCDKKESDETSTDTEGPSYATCLFSRHHFEQPARVFAGLEKPSVVVRPNPVFFKLPPGTNVPSSASLNLPYRSIFAVLTLDSVVIYDTYHTTPLAIARGLHYANLTDAVWSPDGLTLMVSSRDGYISILNFADGELGETYVPALVAAETKIVQEEAAKLASRPIVPVPRAATTTAAATPSSDTSTKAVSVTPPNAGGDAAKVNNKAGKKRVVPTLLPVGNSEINETNAMVTDAAADNKMEESADITGTDTAAAMTAVAAETTTATAAEPNILQPKKKKKRVQPVLVSCD